jgi:hypothetical protein
MNPPERRTWVPLGRSGANDMQPTVPVDSCPVIQDRQGLTNIPCPSFVPMSSGSSRIRLYGLDEASHVVRHILHTPHGLFKFIGVGTDGETPLLLIGGRVLAKLQTGSIIDNGIEGATKLIQHLSKLEREWQDPIRLDWSDEKLPCPIIIYLGDRSVNVVCIKTIPDFNEGLSVHLCPRNTIPTRIEW